ncbi:MAG: rhomboid family intramembrane serine protease, partial [Bacteroidia bacterium]
ASGAIFGVLTAFAIYFPKEKLTFFMPIPLTFEAKTWITILGVMSAGLVAWGYISLNNGASITGGISHFGHLAGMVSALIFFYLLPLFNQK